MVGGRFGKRKNIIFAIPKRRGAMGREESREGIKFIERMKECSKYSRERNLRFASDEARTDNIKKRLIIMESSILAQDERWRQA